MGLLSCPVPVQKAEMSYDEVKKGAEALFS